MDIHSTAIIHVKSKLADNVSVGPYTIIGEHVSVASGTQVGSSCVLEGHTRIGENCRIFTGAVIGSIPQDLKFKNEKSFLEIGNNNTIREYVTVNPGSEENGKTIIGNENMIMAYSHVAHDCIIGNGAVIANVGTLAGHVEIGDGAVIGGIVAIHQFVRMGVLSIVGGCSKVTKDIPPYLTCDGHPARAYGLNSLGLKRAGISGEIVINLKQAFKILFRQQLSTSHALKKIKEEIPASAEISHLVEFIQNSKRGICK